MRPYAEEQTFRKCSYSNPNNCAEVADLPAGAAVRDTQNRDLGHLTFSSSEWVALLIGVRTGS